MEGMFQSIISSLMGILFVNIVLISLLNRGSSSSKKTRIIVISVINGAIFCSALYACFFEDGMLIANIIRLVAVALVYAYVMKSQIDRPLLKSRRSIRFERAQRGCETTSARLIAIIVGIALVLTSIAATVLEGTIAWIFICITLVLLGAFFLIRFGMTLKGAIVIFVLRTIDGVSIYKADIIGRSVDMDIFGDVNKQYIVEYVGDVHVNKHKELVYLLSISNEMDESLLASLQMEKATDKDYYLSIYKEFDKTSETFLYLEDDYTIKKKVVK